MCGIWEQKIEYADKCGGRSSDWESARLKTELSRVQISAAPLEICLVYPGIDSCKKL